MLRFRRSDWIAIALVLGVPLLSCGTFFGYQLWYRHARNWSNEAIAETHRRGDIIRQRIIDYHTRHGQLPPTLAALGTNLPEPTAGLRQWIYNPNTPAIPDTRGEPAAAPASTLNFKLRINASPSGYPTTWYTQAHGKWRIDQ